VQDKTRGYVHYTLGSQSFPTFSVSSMYEGGLQYRYFVHFSV